ncbi:hypothetical protein H4R34_004208 [Dimargaris verticillata]|uniref:Mitochondrial carrier domain-containing protein n=1 Tax=Dimargaris verticillata TaxID=2761393 RepID=A0A9W8AYN4_9FUNG|nr:hypothetical protein H4R34_004208 [Dimargaris verticillata]
MPPIAAPTATNVGTATVLPNHRPAPSKFVTTPAPHATATTYGPTKRQASQVGLSTAVVRSILLKPLYLWYKTPLKLFRPLRIDYLAVARHLGTSSSHPAAGVYAGTTTIATSSTSVAAAAAVAKSSTKASSLSSWRGRFQATSLGLLSHAVRQKGLEFLPKYVFPPLMANSLIGAVLFTTYAYSLPRLQEAWQPAGPNDSSSHTPRTHRPWVWPGFASIVLPGAIAGGLAGLAQTAVAIPFDNLQARFQISDIVSGKYPSIMGFVRATICQTGLPSLWKGARLTLLKDTLGFALFFGTFEGTKNILGWSATYYFNSREDSAVHQHTITSADGLAMRAKLPGPTLQPLVYPSCVLVAGAFAALVYQVVDYPLDRFRHVVTSDLAHLELHHHRTYDVYRLAWRHCQRVAVAEFSGSMRRTLYSGFATNSLKALPATALGFLCFELVRNALDDHSEPEWGEHW